MKAIIFGSSGQDAYFLNELLERSNIQVVNVSRNSFSNPGDVSCFSFVYDLIKDHLPEYIFHFAAISSTKHEYLFENNNAISIGTMNILESVKQVSSKSKVFIAGSAMQFVNEGKPINEDTKFEASSPYSVARIHSVYMARYYREKFGLKIYIGYLFNHDSEFRDNKHINKKIINDLKQIKEGLSSALVIGDLEVKKEFNFAGDVVKAIWIFVNQEKFFEVTIGSGIVHSIREWIKIVCDLLALNFSDLQIEIDKSFKSEYKILKSNPAKIKSLGWMPEITIEKLANRMLISKS